MRRDVRLEIITEAIQRLVPGAVPANMAVTVEVAEQLPNGGQNTWSGTPEGLAEKVITALHGRPRLVDDRSPRARAEDAKSRRDLAGELGALVTADTALTSQPWYPMRPGDLVHVAFETAGEHPAFGETYIVGEAGEGLLGMQLLAHTQPDTLSPAQAEGMAGWFAVDAAEDPLYEAWFEAGPHRLTIVRDGRAVHSGGAR